MLEQKERPQLRQSRWFWVRDTRNAWFALVKIEAETAADPRLREFRAGQGLRSLPAASPLYYSGKTQGESIARSEVLLKAKRARVPTTFMGNSF